MRMTREWNERVSDRDAMSEARATDSMPRSVRRGLAIALGVIGVGAIILVAFRGEAMLLDLSTMIAAFCL